MSIRILLLVMAVSVPLGWTAVYAQTGSPSPGSNDRVVIRTAYEYATVVASGSGEPRAKATAQGPDGQSIPARVTSDAKELRVDVPLAAGLGPDVRIRIDVMLPRRSSEVDILVPRGTIDVSGLPGHLTLESSSGTIRAREIGGAVIRIPSGSATLEGVTGDVQLRTGSANVTMERVKGGLFAQIGAGNLSLSAIEGSVDVTASSGNVSALGVTGDVHVVSINGRTDLVCTGGRIDVSDTSGAITIASAGDDVQVDTAAGRASVTTRLKPTARYVFKTLDGRLEVRVPADSRDFTATIVAYLKRVTLEPPFAGADTDPDGRRRVLRVGSERARIDIEAFGGRVTLGPGVPKPCTGGGVPR